jgi:hypothetical protein
MIASSEYARADAVKRDFRVGDRVRLPAQRPTQLVGRDGAYVGWSEMMDQYLDKVAIVTWLTNPERGTVLLDIDNGGWFWLMDWLSPADDP